MEWISPTGFNDPDSEWANESRAYDGILDNYTRSMAGITSWSSYIELTHSAMYCEKVRFIAATQGSDVTTIDIDVYYSGGWHDVYEGSYTYTSPSFIEKSLASPQTITKVRFRFYNSSAAMAWLVSLTEVDFYGEHVPTVTVQAPTDVLPTTVTANGNVTDKGGADITTRGFKYGLTETDTWDEHDDGTFGTGAFTKALTGLSANTTYFIRAYATNSQGTVYSAWLEFQTAAPGTTPTGSFLNICSDHSGYTYQEHGAETDDGVAYTGFFVLSTDLMEKQGLSILKRIQDLDLYFRKEDSGSMDIYIKEDNEANWQSAGSVLLTGDEDIIVKHLPVDFQAKHYLIKISGANAFRFIGAIINYIPIEGR